MKAHFSTRLATGTALLLSVILLSSCLKEKKAKEVTFTANVPEYMTFDELRSSVDVQEAIPVEDPAKIYLYNNYVFVSERDKGIHVFQDIQSTQPQAIAFINIPGNRDIAIKDDVLYADSYIDLVTLDVADVNNIRVIDRDEDVLPYRFPKYDESHHIYSVDRSKGVVVGWTVEEVTTTCEDYSCIENPGQFFDVRNQNAEMEQAGLAATAGDGKNGTGIAGSLTRFMIHEDYLYSIDNNNMRMFDISSTRNPNFDHKMQIGMNIETLHKQGNTMFVGSETGVYIYDLENASHPEYVSEFQHATGCDPVVADGDYCYVTVRAGTGCGGWDNQMDVINISNINNPTLVNSYTMTEPQGLGVAGNHLFVCDGSAGVKVYNTSDKANPTLVTSINESGYDVIAQNGVLSLIGEHGLHQYSIEDINNISYLNSIAW